MIMEDLRHMDMAVLIGYTVAEHELETALAVVEKFRHHQAATNLLRNYYSALPEGREEMALDIRLVRRREGVQLVVLKTASSLYLYFCSEDDAHYVGEFEKGLVDEELLSLFGYTGTRDFLVQVPKRFESLDPFVPAHATEDSACVACGVRPGDEHILGCPVEQCPWCEAQLSRCNCRFDKLGVDYIERDEQIEHFATLLREKGRIVFLPEHNPSYPTAGNDPSPAELKAQQEKGDNTSE